MTQEFVELNIGGEDDSFSLPGVGPLVPFFRG